MKINIFISSSICSVSVFANSLANAEAIFSQLNLPCISRSKLTSDINQKYSLVTFTKLNDTNYIVNGFIQIIDSNSDDKIINIPLEKAGYNFLINIKYDTKKIYKAIIHSEYWNEIIIYDYNLNNIISFYTCYRGAN